MSSKSFTRSDFTNYSLAKCKDPLELAELFVKAKGDFFFAIHPRDIDLGYYRRNKSRGVHESIVNLLEGIKRFEHAKWSIDMDGQQMTLPIYRLQEESLEVLRAKLFLDSWEIFALTPEPYEVAHFVCHEDIYWFSFTEEIAEMAMKLEAYHFEKIPETMPNLPMNPEQKKKRRNKKRKRK